jgi:ketosteroid isomerase-like protein
VNSFAEDGEFRNARGPDYRGQSFKGKAAIRGYFAPLFAASSDAAWRHTSEFICGNRAVTEWHRTATLGTGERQEWLGCDLYTFRRGLIVMKDTYIKVVV